MAGWQQMLRDEPPEPLTAEQAAHIRRIAIAATSQNVARHVTRRAPVALIAGALLVAVASGVFVARSQPQRLQESVLEQSPNVRQLQFATPGGTRVIWRFDPQFSLKESLP